MTHGDALNRVAVEESANTNNYAYDQLQIAMVQQISLRDTLTFFK